MGDGRRAGEELEYVVHVGRFWEIGICRWGFVPDPPLHEGKEDGVGAVGANSTCTVSNLRNNNGR